MVVVIGVDAGGTKTETVAYSPEGTPLRRALTGYGNLLNNPGEATAHILEGIAACVPAEAKKVHIYIGAAGITAGNNRALLQAAVLGAYPSAAVHIHGDSHLMLYAMFEGRDGMLLIAGTGSIAYAKRGEHFHRYGGWGQLLGDQGSGYDIVHDAFYHMLSNYDHGRPADSLTQRLLTELDTDLYGAVKFFHTRPKSEIAALLPLIVAQAESGDGAALGLLAKAGESLARMAQELYAVMGYEGPVELAAKGSVLEKVVPVRERFRACLDAGSARFLLKESGRSATLGAVYLFREESA